MLQANKDLRYEPEEKTLRRISRHDLAEQIFHLFVRRLTRVARIAGVFQGIIGR